MFIRQDLEDAIKSRFGVEKFTYIGTGRNIVSDCGLLIFDTDKGIIAMEVGFLDVYYIYNAKEHFNHPGQFLKISKEISTLYAFGIQTYLKTNNYFITQFPGKAFDFTQELVLLALEQGGNWNVYKKGLRRGHQE